MSSIKTKKFINNLNLFNIITKNDLNLKNLTIDEYRALDYNLAETRVCFCGKGDAIVEGGVLIDHIDKILKGKKISPSMEIFDDHKENLYNDIFKRSQKYLGTNTENNLIEKADKLAVADFMEDLAKDYKLVKISVEIV